MTAMADDGFWEQPMKVLVDALGQAPPAGGGARTSLEGDPGERTEQGGGVAAYREGSHR
ncbi:MULTISPECIES: hypothetical protein [unclassified Streptomyces]|uniref:hypothetical protein n=1 Tax=unclassified Streptomyces TaxID=2593676 RepID=UPI0015E145AB|nr:hypothetical protein [Streptomyces sp. CB02959]